MAVVATEQVGMGREVEAVLEVRVAVEGRLRAVAVEAVAVVGSVEGEEAEVWVAVTMVVEYAVVAATGARVAVRGAAMAAGRWRCLHVALVARARAPNTAARLQSGKSLARPGRRSCGDRAWAVAMRRLLSALPCLADGGRAARWNVTERPS